MKVSKQHVYSFKKNEKKKTNKQTNKKYKILSKQKILFSYTYKIHTRIRSRKFPYTKYIIKQSF